MAALAGGRVDASVAGGDAAAADLGQLRILLDLHPPALVVGQVPVQGVELVQGHLVDDLLDLVHAPEMARRVEHEATPAEARCVLDAHGRQRDRLGVVEAGQLQQGHGAVEQAGGVTGAHVHAIRGHFQKIGLGAGLGARRIDGETDRAVRLGAGLGQPRFDAATLRQQGRELAGDGAGLLVLGQQRRVGAEREAALAWGDAGRQRHQRQHGRLRPVVRGRGAGGSVLARRAGRKQDHQARGTEQPGTVQNVVSIHGHSVSLRCRIGASQRRWNPRRRGWRRPKQDGPGSLQARPATGGLRRRHCCIGQNCARSDNITRRPVRESPRTSLSVLAIPATSA